MAIQKQAAVRRLFLDYLMMFTAAMLTATVLTAAVLTAGMLAVIMMIAACLGVVGKGAGG